MLDTSVVIAADVGPLSEELAICAATLAELHFAAATAAGRQPRARVMDLLIAATPHAHGARLYTRNAHDLSGLENLLEMVPV